MRFQISVTQENNDVLNFVLLTSRKENILTYNDFETEIAMPLKVCTTKDLSVF